MRAPDPTLAGDPPVSLLPRRTPVLPAVPRPSLRHPVRRRPPAVAARAPPGAPVRPAEQPGHARQLHRLGFDQCLAPDQCKMDAWLQTSPFLRRRHLHLRRLAGLPRASRTSPRLDQHPARARAGGCCRSPSARRPRASPGSRGTATTTRRSAASSTSNALPAGPQAGHRRGRQARSPPRRRSGIAAGSTLWYDLEGFDVNDTHCRESALCVPQRLDPAAARARLRLGRLLQRRLGHEDRSTTPG